MAKFQVFDTNGKLLAEQEKTFNYKRHSMKCAAQQKFLDKMYVAGAVEGVIDEGSYEYEGETVKMINSHFKFDAKGRSQHYFPKKNA